MSKQKHKTTGVGSATSCIAVKRLKRITALGRSLRDGLADGNSEAAIQE